MGSELFPRVLCRSLTEKEMDATIKLVWAEGKWLAQIHNPSLAIANTHYGIDFCAGKGSSIVRLENLASVFNIETRSFKTRR